MKTIRLIGTVLATLVSYLLSHLMLRGLILGPQDWVEAAIVIVGLIYFSSAALHFAFRLGGLLRPGLTFTQQEARDLLETLKAAREHIDDLRAERDRRNSPQPVVNGADLRAESIRRAAQSAAGATQVPRGSSVSDLKTVRAKLGLVASDHPLAVTEIRTPADLDRWEPGFGEGDEHVEKPRPWRPKDGFKPASELKTRDDLVDEYLEQGWLPAPPAKTSPAKATIRPTTFPPIWDGGINSPYYSARVGLNNEEEAKSESGAPVNLRLREKEVDPNAKLLPQTEEELRTQADAPTEH